MCAVSNGLAAFAPNTIIPVTSSFFMFYLYAAPAVRMGALQKLQIIHAATHDSIGMGEDGPTHQPIELANLFRAMPNLLYIRPGDSEETAGAWIAAIEAKNTPSIISTSRHALPQLSQTRRDGVAFGAYVLHETINTKADITLIGVGAELSLAVDVAEQLKHKKIEARIVSFPCQRLFEKQSLDYKRATLQRHLGIPAVVIEPYAPNGWERYADAGICLKRFGHSLPGKAAYKFFGYEVDVLVSKVVNYLSCIQSDELLRREFVDL
jgi:dihydroxyacetone synthase